MSEIIQSIRGMNDILPPFSQQWRLLEQFLISCLKQYGYEEIRFPIVESTQLFKRAIGDLTDIVEKEMYTFIDKNGDSLTLRPEGTASCLRACLENGLLHRQPQKLWYLGPMFRHEKPQKGRYRQFHHFGVEALNIAGLGIELELIAICQRLWQGLDLLPFLSLEINSLGTTEERLAYKEALIVFFQQHIADLDEDSQRRLHKNPLRILDSKNPSMQDLLLEAPTLLDSLGPESALQFADFCQALDNMGISYTVNKRLVRGLDYYNGIVFEWTTDKLGSQATLCGGGRYDALTGQLSAKELPAIGFAIGLERLLLLMQTLELSLKPPKEPCFFIMADSDKSLIAALILAEKLRNACSTWQLITHTALGSFKNQFKRADKSNADFALIIGEKELQAGSVSVKNLRQSTEQLSLSYQDLIAYLHDYFGEK